MINTFIKINKRLSDKFFSWINKKISPIDFSEDYFYKELNSINTLTSCVLEIGGTQCPLFKNAELKFYAGLDIDSNFNWQEFYHVYYNNSCTEPINDKFDFVFSKYLLEHLNDNKKTFQNIINSLKLSGKSIHIFPLGLHHYSLLTKLVDNSIQRKLIRLLRPHSESVGGYPVYFNLCTSVALERFFRKQADVKCKIKYFYGAEDYFAFFLLVMLFNRICHLLKLKLFASNAVLII